MKSRTTRRFRRLFDDLPADVQGHARIVYRRWRTDPSYPSLHFKRSTQSRFIRFGSAHITAR